MATALFQQFFKIKVTHYFLRSSRTILPHPRPPPEFTTPNKMMKSAALLLSAVCSVSAIGQVHVAFGTTDDVLTVSWTSEDGSAASEVAWGKTPTTLDSKATGDCQNYSLDAGRVWYTRTASMTDLEVGATYSYQVGDSKNGFSEVFNVTNRQQPPAGQPFRHMMFGDMGAKCAFSLCNACTQNDTVCDANTCAGNTTAGLVGETGAGMFLHVGDFAYNLADDNGTVGDQFFRNMEQVAAKVPYMISHGNHEDKKGNLEHFLARFRAQPVNSVPDTVTTANISAPNTLFFSWDYGNVHWIAFSTELFIDTFEAVVDVKRQEFLDWIEADLIKANLPENRAKNPWIVVHGHRTLYHGSHNTIPQPTIVAAMEPLFHKYGVSFSINGHEHSYQRSYPVYQSKVEYGYENPNATIYIVTGCAGSREMHSPFGNPAPAWSAFRSNSFGYTRLLVHNATHAHIQQVSTDPTTFPMGQYGDVLDDFWVVQNYQGGFNSSYAPKIEVTRDDECPAGLCESHDHFDPILRPLLGETDQSIPLHKVIQDYKDKHGEVAWVRHLHTLLAHVNGESTEKRVLWEDGNLDAEEQAALRSLQWKDQEDA